jgi:hypothetical protein
LHESEVFLVEIEASSGVTAKVTDNVVAAHFLDAFREDLSFFSANRVRRSAAMVGFNGLKRLNADRVSTASQEQTPDFGATVTSAGRSRLYGRS